MNMSLEPELYGVNERTAAMIMAIVADEMAVPVEELDFKYIREVEYMKFKVTLNGKTYEVEAEKGAPMPETVYTAPAAAPAPAVEAPAAPATAPAPAAAPAAVSGTVVSSPLPGNVLAIEVNPGEAVKAGQVLVLIEAMKMENEIVAPCDGVVKQILVNKGAVVATGDKLLVI